MKNLLLILIPALLSASTILQQPGDKTDWIPDVETAVSDLFAEPVAEPSHEPVEAPELPKLVSTPAPEPIPEDSIPHLTRDDLQCVDDNMAKLVASAESQKEILNNLTADIAAKLAELNKSAPTCTCTCNCPTAEEIADAVEARLRPLLVAKNETTGSARKIAVSPDAPFELAPGEVLAGYERIPGSGVMQPVTSLGTIHVSNAFGASRTINRYQLDGWEVRTAPKPNGGVVGQVRQAVQQTCRQVWNPVTNRFERQCGQ